LVALVLLVGWIAWMVAHTVSRSHAMNMLVGLPRTGVVAADVSGPQVGGGWLVTSGTLLTRNGQLWSGRPDSGPPNPAASRTGSATLRAVSVRSDLTNVRLHVELREEGLTSTEHTPEHSWDGVHLFLRYRDANNLYAVDLMRRDGVLTIKRKSTAGLGGAAGSASAPDVGVYTTIATTQLAVPGGWHEFDTSITDVAGGVQITLAIDGQQVLSTIDGYSDALTGPGRIGLRGDNAEFTVRKFDVHTKGERKAD
jgi:hypothetical protein